MTLCCLWGFTAISCMFVDMDLLQVAVIGVCCAFLRDLVTRLPGPYEADILYLVAAI